jgi:acetylornithine deacetylase/succinyl-diaminopimelate desuccinylase-like protein
VSLRRPGLLSSLAALGMTCLIGMSCGKAEGVRQDPAETEAEEAFVAYLRIDTTNPPGNETAGATFLRDLLVKNGVEARLVGDDPKRHGVYARLESGTNEPALLLLSHIDVVPADASRWRNPPFAGKREGGYIWGRGAIDDKPLTIAGVMSLLDLERRGAKLRRDVVLLAVPDEERGGLVGAKLLLDTHPELFRNVGFVLNEGGSNRTAVDRVLFWGIEVQQKVPLWLRIVAESPGGHGAAPRETRGAPAKLVTALAAIDALETPYRLTDTVARVAARAAAMRTGHRAAGLRLVREPLDVARIERELPLAEKVILQDTIAITNISAAGAVNVIPARASAEVDIRLVPGSDPAEMLARVREAAGKNATVEVILAGEASPESPIDTELFETVSRVLQKSAPGSSVAPVFNPGTSDSRFFRARGMTAYGIAPFKLNYYDIASVHADDERIRARFFGEGVRVVRDIVREFCERRHE